MNTTAIITAILAEILDLDPAVITAETYVIRDLEAESIDLLEIGVAIQHRLGIEVDDDTLFLKNLRIQLARAEQDRVEPLTLLAETYPHLDAARLRQILDDVSAGPVLRVRDLVAYVDAAHG